ncbi:hypothetical protein PHYC_02360 [Phycisphaerales bacterium]|nr:hypothetical protein PHYC_02360 [Phycisphaerales bacterium]
MPDDVQATDVTQTRVTQLLAAPLQPAQAAELLAMVYDQLRRLAQSQMNRERPEHTLQATALVHEAYARLVGPQSLKWESRGHFFNAAAEAMRRILIEHARAKQCLKRGGDGESKPGRRVRLESAMELTEAEPAEFLSVDDAMRRLEERDADLARLVRLRFYAGLTEAETAAILGVSDRTVRRDWLLAKAFLHRELENTGA